MAIEHLTNANLTVRPGTYGNVNVFAHTYPVSGETYTVSISGGHFPKYFNGWNNFSATGNNKKITEIVSFGILQSATSLQEAWMFCTNLTSISPGNLGSCENFYGTWYGCQGLSSFPVVDVSKGKTFGLAWYICRNLKDFPSLDFSSATDFTAGFISGFPYGTGAWAACFELSSFGAPTNTNNLTSIQYAWSHCQKLKSFPAFNTSNVKKFDQAWNLCSSLTGFPVIDTSKGVSFGSTWQTCLNLSAFPLLNFSEATSMSQAWNTCPNLQTFPSTNFPKVTSFYATWEIQNPNSYTHRMTDFPAISCPSVYDYTNGFGGLRQTWKNQRALSSFAALSCPQNNNFYETWSGCWNLSTVGGFKFYDDTFKSLTDGTLMFSGVTLPTQTWSTILTSICAYNVNNNKVLHGGNSLRNATGTTAHNALAARGWSITDGGAE